MPRLPVPGLVVSRKAPDKPEGQRCSACREPMILIEPGQVTHPACDLPDRGITRAVPSAPSGPSPLSPCARCGGQCVRYGPHGSPLCVPAPRRPIGAPDAEVCASGAAPAMS